MSWVVGIRLDFTNAAHILASSLRYVITIVLIPTSNFFCTAPSMSKPIVCRDSFS